MAAVKQMWDWSLVAATTKRFEHEDQTDARIHRKCILGRHVSSYMKDSIKDEPEGVWAWRIEELYKKVHAAIIQILQLEWYANLSSSAGSSEVSCSGV